MILYHGSPEKFSQIKRSQAEAADGISVPAGELKNAIYLTPSLEYAIAQGVSTAVRGLTYIDEERGTINFEDPSRFNPDQLIYIYEVDTEKIPLEKLHQIDKLQIAVDEDEIIPEGCQEFIARELLRYYSIVDWEGNEIKNTVDEIKRTKTYK